MTANKTKISRQLLDTYCYVVYLALFHFPHSLRDKDPLTPRYWGVGMSTFLVGIILCGVHSLPSLIRIGLMCLSKLGGDQSLRP